MVSIGIGVIFIVMVFIFVAVALVSGIIAVYFISRSRKKRSNKDILDDEQ